MINRFTLLLVIALFSGPAFSNEGISKQIDEQTWDVISQSVIDRDIVAMASTYHPDAVLVNSEKTSPIASTLIRWGEGMKKEAEAGNSARVAFRFSERQDNEYSAFQTGIFHYVSIDSDGNENNAYINFESLLVKKDGRWLFTMERQLDDTDKAAWDALK
jgi:ketosteroid isomerase-like protein